ncbi:MAG: excisionase family DNA-binding protein [Kiloniellaceae bacterium]
MDNDILTTAQAARLLGVSVRTAQLLIEGGALASWKTPGGHRRVYRSDVLSYMARTNAARAVHSARIVLLASPKRLPALQEGLAAVSGYTVDPHASPYAALLSIGSQVPALVVVDLHDAVRDRIAFLRQLATLPALSRTKFVAVGGGPSVAAELPSSPLCDHVTDAQKLSAGIRAYLQQDQGPSNPFAVPPPFPIASNESQRLAALERSGLLRVTPDKAFDQLTWLAGYSLGAPVALVTLLTETHQIFKAQQGLEALKISETPRSWAFCNHTILQRGVFTVGDLAKDARFVTNPAVAGGPHFRFYAGAPVVDTDGFALGSLCVIDYEPRVLDSPQERTLEILAKFASGEVRSRAAERP